MAEERDSLRQQLELQRTAAEDAQEEVGGCHGAAAGFHGWQLMPFPAGSLLPRLQPHPLHPSHTRALHHPQAKQLRAALKQKAATERALRDELRRALAGQGLTPGHASPRQQRSPASAGLPLAGGRLRQDQQQQQRHAREQPGGGGGQAHKRVGSALSPRTQSAQKVVVRQASAWKQPQPPLGSPASLRGDSDEEHGGGDGGEGLIPAEPSPTRAFARLQEQRRQRQGSRLGAQPLRRDASGGGGEADAAQRGWKAAATGWQLEQSEVAGEAAHRGQHVRLDNDSGSLRPGLRPGLEPVSPPNACPRAAPHAPPAQPSTQQGEGARLPATLLSGDAQQLRLYSSALDEQIAALETDLEQLGLGGGPSPIALLQAQARAGAAAAPAEAGRARPQAAAAAQQQRQQEAVQPPRSAAAESPGMAARRPSSATAASSAGKGPLHLSRPGWRAGRR
jgi:hypothetical protein